MMLGLCFVACLQVKQRQIGVNELVFGLELFGFVALGDGSGVIASAIIRHPERQTRVEVLRLFRQERLQLANGLIIIGLAEVEHRVIVLLLRRRHENRQSEHGTIVPLEARNVQMSSGGFCPINRLFENPLRPGSDPFSIFAKDIPLKSTKRSRSGSMSS